jgi:hypothetical protein
MKSRKQFPFVAFLVILALLVAGCAATAEPEVAETEPPLRSQRPKRRRRK